MEVFVTPSDNVICGSQSPCLTLNEYAREADQYFVDNTTFIFLPGVHHLDLQLNLESLSNVSFLGSYEEKVTQIVFNHGSKITWTKCMNVSVNDFIININGLAESDEDISAGLEFDRTRSILSNVTVFGNNTFCATFVNDWSEVNVNNLHILGASSVIGSALFAIDSKVNFYGNNSFINNTAMYHGGAIALYNCTSNFSGYISFVNNIAKLGGVVYILDGSLIVSGYICFINNTAIRGGAIIIYRCSSNIIGNISFINNTADRGGAMAIFCGNHSVSGNISFIKNSATIDGGAVDLAYGTLVMSGDISFINNTCTNCKGGAMAVYGHNRDGGGDTLLNLTGSLRFVNNSAKQGGAIAFFGISRLLLSDPLKMEFIENHADSTGGALSFAANSNQCVEPQYSLVDKKPCLIELSSITNINLNFYENTADDAGTVLYGGALDSCILYTGGGVRDNCGNIANVSYIDNPITTISSISNITSSDNVSFEFSSDSLRVCICEDNGDFLCYRKTIETVTGKEITLKAVIADQDNRSVPMSVRIYLDNDVQLINATQRVQKTGKSCTELNYRLFSETDSSSVTLVPDCRGIGIDDLYVRVIFHPCPDACIREKSKCVCEHRLQQFNVTCNVDSNSIEKTSNSFWMGIMFDNKTYIGLIIHSGGCPFDFCIDTPVSIKLDNIDVQCNHNHSGTLCGPCKENHSIAFGTLHCLDCSNAYLALILPFALAGVVLVAVLLLLNLSVAVGTVNGLIFYANVVQANRSIFFPLGETNILTVFIAWLNLDLGIETCFYDGMDAYAFTWLQFLFPLYVWVLIGLIIIASRYSRKIAQSLGNNPVPTLATLLLQNPSQHISCLICHKS